MWSKVTEVPDSECGRESGDVTCPVRAVRIPLWPRLNEPNYDEFIADAVNQASSDHDTALP
ncbi:hypothetical protein PCANC_13440 [Puccinia coronata f. sp. avenae]|uniref:Uncharacterized protein n=1 Tax=Puccinia coronata f. sp. avenae TaxID=200324 RepID=A0A2N5V2J9_9BASI|nr:hypothetical protein PCANC_13440 [Puccinia coronata f. sp. avenae]